MFAVCVQGSLDGGAEGLWPEGTTHSDAAERTAQLCPAGLQVRSNAAAGRHGPQRDSQVRATVPPVDIPDHELSAKPHHRQVCLYSAVHTYPYQVSVCILLLCQSQNIFIAPEVKRICCQATS